MDTQLYSPSANKREDLIFTVAWMHGYNAERKCIPARCGDGIINGTDQCDDGNAVDGDGCNRFCQLEIPPSCGDHVLDPDEQCDDGPNNGKPGHDCNESCVREVFVP